jgi:hypothetical protein
MLMALPMFQRLLEAVLSESAVGQARDGVVVGLIKEEFFLFLLTGNIFLDGDIVSDLPLGVADGRNRRFFPV